MSCWVRGPYSAFSLSSDSDCFKRVSVRKKVVEERNGKEVVEERNGKEVEEERNGKEVVEERNGKEVEEER